MVDDKTTLEAVPDPPPAFITLTQNDQGGWTLDSNLQPGQAKWTLCEVAATLLAELKPKG